MRYEGCDAGKKKQGINKVWRVWKTSPIDAVISKSHRSERNHVKSGVFIQDIPGNHALSDTYPQDSKHTKIIIVFATIIIATGMSIELKVPYVGEKCSCQQG